MKRSSVCRVMTSRLGIWAMLTTSVVVLGCQEREVSQVRPSGRGRAIASQMLQNPEATPSNRYSPSESRALAEPPLSLVPSSTLPVTPNSSLVLYDAGGSWGYLGELYAIGAANLAGHFGRVTAKSVSAYVCGELEQYAAVIYQGSTYDEPLSACLLDDLLATRKPIVWAGFNVWRLVDRAGFNAFVGRFGWTWKGLDAGVVAAVQYKGRVLTRYESNQSGIMDYVIYDPSKVTRLAEAVRSDQTTFPWAVRSDNLTYVGEIPFTYMKEEDRYLVFADLLFDALAPATAERHRALVRLEDLSPASDVAELRAVADYLASQSVPFGFGVISEYVDPLGTYNAGVPESAKLTRLSAFASALQYLVSKGGVMVEHGQTHQYSNVLNPYSGVSADDTEFYRVTEDSNHVVQFIGPLPEDSLAWADGRIRTARSTVTSAGLAAPTIFEFPHYTASANSYRAAAAGFAVRWERSLYFSNVLTGGTVDHSRWFGQLFPYVVRDVYGSVVLPENLGDIEPEAFYQYPARSPADLVNAAEKNLVVRDGLAGFYFHPFFALDLLKQTVTGIKALGYTFVRPTDVVGEAP